ncbi:hypothetical protein FO519_005535 [Halicephalobus sp. NKZ332]|nr:hypothetical protein FO519_005535 [Halicephalobus sp. NKZ332]
MYGSDSDDENTSTSVSTAPLPSSKPNIPPEIQPRSSISKQTQPITVPSRPVEIKSNEKSDGKKESEGTKKTMTTSDLRAMTSSPPLENTAEEKEDEDEFEVEGTQFVGVHEFHAENPEDLDVEVGEQFTLLATRSDGWWKCENSRGEVGLVPKNVLQHIPHQPAESSNLQEEVYSTINKDPERHPSTVFPEPPEAFVEKELKKKERMLQSSTPNTPSHPGPQNPMESSSAPNPLESSGLLTPSKSREPKKSKKSTEQETPQLVQQQWKPLQVDKSDHFGLICHLFPRLSESNLHFHDLYWLWNFDEKCFKIRKRKVKFCRIIKIYGVGPPEYQQTGFEVRFFLFDKRNVTGRQVVSNVLTDKIRVDASDSFSFFKSDYCSFVVRSNYNLPDVVLRAEVHHQGTLLGYSDTTLLSPDKVPVQSMKYITPILKENGEPETKNSKIVIHIQDIPSSLTTITDSLPDVLLCRENRIPIYAMYRNLLAENLATRSTLSSTTWISDPVIATFPLASTDPDLMDFFAEELNQKKGLRSTVSFRQIYINTVLPIIATTPLPEDRQLRKQFLKSYSESLKRNKSGIEFISVAKSRPIDPFEFVVDLTSVHALD